MVIQKRWTSGPEGRHLRLRLRANNQLFESTFLRGGPRFDTLKEGSRVQVIFCLEQAWSPPGSEPKQDISLKVLDILPQRF